MPEEYALMKEMCTSCNHHWMCKRSNSMITLVDKEGYIPEPVCEHYESKEGKRQPGQHALADHYLSDEED